MDLQHGMCFNMFQPLTSILRWFRHLYWKNTSNFNVPFIPCWAWRGSTSPELKLAETEPVRPPLASRKGLSETHWGTQDKAGGCGALWNKWASNRKFKPTAYACKPVKQQFKKKIKKDYWILEPAQFWITKLLSQTVLFALPLCANLTSAFVNGNKDKALEIQIWWIW